MPRISSARGLFFTARQELKSNGLIASTRERYVGFIMNRENKPKLSLSNFQINLLKRELQYKFYVKTHASRQKERKSKRYRSPQLTSKRGEQPELRKDRNPHIWSPFIWSPDI